MSEPCVKRPEHRAFPAEADLLQIRETYERGHTVLALGQALALAPLQHWHGAEACILGARIAAHTGGRTLALQLSARARKSDRASVAAVVQYGYQVLSQRGPLATWQLLRGVDLDPVKVPVSDIADVHALRGYAASLLRDFTTAEDCLRRAEGLAPQHPWIRLQRAYLLEYSDRIEEALEVACMASELHPFPHYRPAVQCRVHLLQLLDRDEDAITLLEEATESIQNASLLGQLYLLLAENGRWDVACRVLQKYGDAAPLIEKQGVKWLESQRARVAYHLGRYDSAASHASGLEDRFHQEFAARLTEPRRSEERMLHAVDFVRQHFKTCAPATLAALGKFWRMPAEHLQLAEAVCYDGTPHWQQREWAERNGWHVREFRVTWETLIELVKRGLPFAISTVEATSAHMMAVVGFDLIRNTVLLRDPGQPYVVELWAEEFFAKQSAYGPRGILFVPEPERNRVSDLLLPDEALHLDYHNLNLALSRHDREGAVAALRAMEEKDTAAPLTWDGCSALASYDANAAEQLRCSKHLLDLFPSNDARILRHAWCLREASLQERREFLSGVCRGRVVDPAVLVELSRLLRMDGRLVDEAKLLLKRAMRQRALDASAIAASADLQWDAGCFHEATDAYRFAATLEGFNEYHFQSWFIASRRTHRVQEALQHLLDRFELLGARSDQPALTLAWAWTQLDLPGRAQQVLEQAIARRPQSGALWLRSATLRAELGDAGRASELLDQARGLSREADWLRARIAVAENAFEFSVAHDLTRTLLQLEPLSLDVHQTLCRILSRLQGVPGVLHHLRSACSQYPHHIGLKRLQVEWSREVAIEEREAAIRDLVQAEGADGWAWRELALVLSLQQRHEEAVEAARQACRVEPWESRSASILGYCLRRRGDTQAAKIELMRAIAQSVDNDSAIEELFALAQSDVSRKEALQFVEDELIRQVVSGQGLLAFADLARSVLEGPALLSLLERAHRERQDLCHAWSALVTQLGHMGRLEQALDLAQGATRRFPHLQRAWLDLSLVRRWRGEMDEEIDAARRALDLQGTSVDAALALTDALMRAGRMTDAQDCFELMLRRVPHDAQLRAGYADLMWRFRRPDDAIAALEQALRTAPAYTWAWNMLVDWSTQCREQERVIRFARALVAERPGDPRAWLLLADCPGDLVDLEERLQAVSRTIELDPHSAEGWDRRAELLASAERFDEALQCCIDGLSRVGARGFTLRGRMAWIEHQRGHAEQSIRSMRELLVDNSGYVWGWRLLSTWLMEQGDVAGAAEALETLQQLRPHDSWISRELGRCRLQQEDKVGAERAFSAAFLAAPDDVAAAHNLLDLQLERGDLEAAQGTLELMKVHQPGTSTLAASIRLHLRKGENREALEVLRLVISDRGRDPWAHEFAVEAFHGSSCSSRAVGILRQDCRMNDSPESAAAIINLLCAHRRFAASAWFYLRLPEGAARRRTSGLIAQQLAHNKRCLLIAFLARLRPGPLREDTTGWGYVGYALVELRLMRTLGSWMSDWNKRPDVQPWMLFNYCVALRCLGRREDAHAVALRTIERWPHREGASYIHNLLALEFALRGNVAEASRHLEQVGTVGSGGYEDQIVAIARNVIGILEAPAGPREGLWLASKADLAACMSLPATLVALRDARRSLRQALRVIADSGIGVRARIWSLWRLHWQWPVVILAGYAVVVGV